MPETTPLTDKQASWLQIITGDEIARWENHSAARSDALDAMVRKREAIKGRLDRSFAFTLRGKKRKDDLSSKHVSQDSMKELDVIHDDLSKRERIDDSEAFEVAEAYKELEALQEEMKQATGPDGEPLFSEADIMRELYTPLVRQGVMSENQVPDQYSEISNVFNQSAALYNKRLEDYSQSTTSDPTREKMAYAGHIAQQTKAIIVPITQAIGDSTAEQIAKGIGFALEAGVKVGDHILDRACQDGVDTVAAAVGNIVALFVEKKVGDLVKTGISTGPAAVKMTLAFKNGDTKGGIEALGEAIAAIGEVVDSDGEIAMGTQSLKDTLGHAGHGLVQLANLSTLTAAIESGDPAEIVGVLAEVAKGTVSHTIGSIQKVDKDEDELSEDEAANNDSVDGLIAMINAGIGMTTSTTKTAHGIVTGDGEKIIEGVGELAGQTADLAGGNTQRREGNDDQSRDVVISQGASSLVESTAKGTLRGLTGDTDGVVESISEGLDTVRDTVVEAKLTEYNPDRSESDGDKSRIEVQRDELSAIEELEGSRESSVLSDDDLASMRAKLKLKTAPPIDPEKLERAQQKMKEMEEARTREELESTRKEYRSMLEMSVGGMDPELTPEARALLAEQFDIDKLIQQMEADNAILKTADSIFSASGDVAAAIVPQLVAIKAGKEFLKNVVAAAQRAIELNTFVDSLDDASSAVSAYADAIKKRISDTKLQLADHTLEAIIQAAITVGAAMSATGPLSGAGLVIQKSGESAKSAKDLALGTFKKAQVASAWKNYRAALANPLDRKAKRLAMSTNATLAKYALAYGAYAQNDAIAMDVVRKCGLSKETLAHPDTNVDKVVRYLEVRFSEDQQVLQSVSMPKAWLGGTAVALTAESWMAIKLLAKQKADLRVGGGEGRIERYLVSLDDSAYRSRAPDEALEDGALEAYLGLLSSLQGALEGYSPVRPGTDDPSALVPHQDMLSIASDLKQLAVQEQKTAQATR